MAECHVCSTLGTPSPSPLTPAARQEAEGLVELAELVTPPARGTVPIPPCRSYEAVHCGWTSFYDTTVIATARLEAIRGWEGACLTRYPPRVTLKSGIPTLPPALGKKHPRELVRA